MAIVALPVYANLVPTSFGFPVIWQSGVTSAFYQDEVHALDTEEMNIEFGIFSDDFNLGSSVGPLDAAGINLEKGATSNVLPFGPANLAFPSIDQTTDLTMNQSHTDFSQAKVVDTFTYPLIGVGQTAIPGFGMGW
jgi:hypothetical protein